MGKRGSGSTQVHVAIDAYSRLAYSEFAGVENTADCVAFLARAVAWFHTDGITIERILTDNGDVDRSTPRAQRCAELGIKSTAAPSPTVPARPERQGRALRPLPPRRMGVRPTLDLRSQEPARP